MALEPYFSQFIEKLRPDIERLRHSNEFGVKIYNRLVKQYPQLSSSADGGSGGVKGKVYSAKKGAKERRKSGDRNSGSGATN